METMTKEELVDAINTLDPSYARLKIDLTKYTVEELQKHYLRKKNAPISRNSSGSKGWYSNYEPRKVAPSNYDTDNEEVTPSRTTTKEEAKTVALSGFDALKKE